MKDSLLLCESNRDYSAQIGAAVREGHRFE